MLPHNVRTNPVGGGAHDAPQVSLQCSHKQKAPSGRGLPREQVGEHARPCRTCEAGKFIRLSHPKFGD